MSIVLTYASSSGHSQTDPNASLGGYASTSTITTGTANSVFRDISYNELMAGLTIYRFIDIYNDTGSAWSSVKFFTAPTTSSYTEITVGYDATDQPHNSSWLGEVLADEKTAPTDPSMTFTQYSSLSPLSLPNIPAGEYVRLCLKLTVTIGETEFGTDNFSLNVQRY